MKLINQEERIQILSEDVNVMEIVKELTTTGTVQLDEPFYVFNIGDIVKKHQTWIENMPRVIPHYAVKCNDNEFVLATLAALGTSFDCASKGEISKILDLGVNPDRIIFANPTKPNSHIRMAASNNVKTMTFDCDVELHKMKIYCPDAR
jgi:ornithine decarboxylase